MGEEEIDNIKVLKDRLVCGKKELLFKFILYSKQVESRDDVSNCFFYNSKKSKINHMRIKCSSSENRERLDAVITNLMNQRREKKKMFAFVNPSSGYREGVTVFYKTVHPHLLNGGFQVEHEVTEKTGEKSLEEIAANLDYNNYDAILILGETPAFVMSLMEYGPKKENPIPKLISPK